jgi:oxygen-independent coproporphyrinogen-3 oxidase
MEADGLVALSPEKVTVTQPGRFFLRNIAMPFDAYLKQQSAEKPRFSKTL